MRSYFHYEMPPFTAYCEEKKVFYSFKMADCEIKVYYAHVFLSDIIFRQMFSFVESSNIECAD